MGCQTFRNTINTILNKHQEQSMIVDDLIINDLIIKDLIINDLIINNHQ